MTPFARRASAFGLAASVVLLLRCEAIVPDTVPQFTCQGTSPEACPTGFYCNGSGCKACEPQDICDHLDNDCNGKVDDGKLCDADGDGFTWCGQLGTDGKPTQVDCDDNDPAVYPGAPEICDGKDNDCDGKIDNGASCAQANAQCINGKCVTNPCDPNSANSCPSGEHCDSVSHTCVNDTLQDIGQPCSADAECKPPYFCAAASVVGQSVLPTVGKGMCTEPCCSSGDCPMPFVCYDAGTGGRFCVDPTKLGRGAVGSEAAGTNESSGSRCRSGVAENGMCADTCCSDANCTNGTACVLGNMDNHDGLYCSPPPGSGGQNAGCGSGGASDCHDGACVDYVVTARCVTSCCSTSQCKGLFFGPTACYYEQTNAGDYVPLCSEPQQGGGSLGASCGSNSDCASGDCYTDLVKQEKYCTDACCTDNDCGQGWVCRPNPTLPRCIKQ